MAKRSGSRVCSIEGCGKPHEARGWCPMHYQRWRSNGSPLVVQRVADLGSDEARRAARRVSRDRWVRDNPEKMRAARVAWKKKNREAVRRSRREVKKRYPLLNRAYVKARQARKKRLTVVSFTSDQLMQRMAFYGNVCWMCGTASNITLDHVKPLSKGGAHMLCNLRPACLTCNCKKGDQWPYVHK